MKLFRVLFPAWRFFTEVTELPVLYHRVAVAGEFGPWIPSLEKPPRRPWSAVFNPEGNLYLAFNTLLQQVESDIGELQSEEVDRFEDTPSFKLTLNLVRFQLRARKDIAVDTPFQFKIVRQRQGSVADGFEESFLTSKTYHY